MSLIVNNNFIDDTYKIRSERLLTIQKNFVSIQFILQAPVHIASWAKDCSDAFADVISISGVGICEDADSDEAILEIEEEILMEEEYKKIRSLGIAIYKDIPNYLKDYGFDSDFPLKRTNKLNRVDLLLKTYFRHLAAKINPLIPVSLIMRLTDARNDFEDVLSSKYKGKSIQKQSFSLASDHFVTDSTILNELKNYWFAKMGLKDERITLIGMVNDYN
jgi:hypothetical protein